MGNGDGQLVSQKKRGAPQPARRVISQIQHLETDRVPYTIGYSELPDGSTPTTAVSSGRN